MITAEEAFEIAKKYLSIRNRDFMDIGEVTEINFLANQAIAYGRHFGERMDVWSIGYGVEWGFDRVSYFIEIDALTGEVLYTISPHGYVEEFEEE